MNKAQEKYMSETHKIPITYDDEHYGELQFDYIRWLEEKICQCSDSDLNAVLGEVRADVQELFSAITNYMLLTSHCHVIDAQERLSNAMQKVGEHFA